MIQSFGKGFLYAPGVMLAVSIVFSILAFEGPTTLAVEVVMNLIATYGTEEGNKALSLFLGRYFTTAFTLGLLMFAFDLLSFGSERLSSKTLISKPAVEKYST